MFYKWLFWTTVLFGVLLLNPDKGLKLDICLINVAICLVLQNMGNKSGYKITTNYIVIANSFTIRWVYLYPDTQKEGQKSVQI